MVELTPAGKIAVAAAAILLVYFFVLPVLLGLLFPQDNVQREREIKVVAFLKTFDLDSVKLQGTLRELQGDKSLQGMLTMTIVNIEAEPGKMEQHRVNSTEVPCFILGTEKYQGWHSVDWFREKINSIADLNAA